MTIKMTPIGSCRIVDPLRRARDTFGFKMNRGRSMGFTHSSPEAVQQLKFMLGEVDIPEALWPCVSNTDREEVIAQEHDASDIYLVELSSEKILSHGDTYLQLNYLRTHFGAFFKDNTRKNAYWKAIEKQTPEEVAAFLDEVWSETPEQQKEAAFLREVRLRRADEAQTRRDIRYLRDTLPNVLFITHVNALEDTGTTIKTRDRFVQMVKQIAEEEGCAIYDPTELVMSVGQTVALEDDLNHYNEPFKDRVAQDWFDKHLTQKMQDIQAEKDKVTEVAAG